MSDELTRSERESLLASWREGSGRRDVFSDERLERVEALLGLKDFLLARIADDEGRARRALATDDPEPDRLGVYDAARVLAECRTKRTLIDQVQDAWKMFPRPPWFNPDSKYAGDTPYVLRVIATVYADHPDYDQEWRLS